MADSIATPNVGADDFARRFALRAGNLMWLLGAGASASAGIPTAGGPAPPVRHGSHLLGQGLHRVDASGESPLIKITTRKTGKPIKLYVVERGGKRCRVLVITRRHRLRLRRPGNASHRSRRSSEPDRRCSRRDAAALGRG